MELTKSSNLGASIKLALDSSANLWPTWRALPTVPRAQSERVFGRLKTERLAIMEAVFAVLLREAGDRQWVLFENAAAADEYVKIRHHDGSLYGEVSSRECEEPMRPITQGAVVRLGKLGFTRGAPERNFSRDALPLDPAPLARLVGCLFRVAYGPGAPQGARIQGKGSAITATVASLRG